VSRDRAAILLLLGAAVLGGCGSGGDAAPPAGETPEPPLFSQGTDDAPQLPGPLGFPEAATKNTTRVPGTDAVVDAAAVALATHPSSTSSTRPQAVTLVDRRDWAAAISGSQLTGAGVRAPILLVDGSRLPTATGQAIARLKPTGVRDLEGVQAIRVATPVRPQGLTSVNIEGAGPAALARGIDAMHTRATGEPTDAVVVAPLAAPAFAMPAAGWAAKSGDPVLWTSQDSLPPDTVAAIRTREDPRIYVLGPRDAIGDGVVRRLERLGDVERIEGADPAANAIAFARFRDADFGWGVVDPGHGLVFADSARPADAAAASALSAAGSYGPLLLLEDGELPATVREYLLDIRPGYESDPVRGVYNHAWLMGDATTIPVTTQSRIDSLLEIQPVDPIP